jgi:hypothetical protein
MNALVNRIGDTFANLAAAPASDCQMLADLKIMNKELTKQIVAKDSK